MYGWIQAIDEAMVTHHLGVADEYDSYDTARRKLNELIDWHVAVATDPRANGGWQLVPVEATLEMVLDGAWQCLSDVDDVMESCAKDTWKAMLAAAPKRGDSPTSSKTTTPP